MECAIETAASTILDFLEGLRRSFRVTFEEGTSAAWLSDLIKPATSPSLVVWDPRGNALLREGSKSQPSMGGGFAVLLRWNVVRSVAVRGREWRAHAARGLGAQ